jgi:hypothetical protein
MNHNIERSLASLRQAGAQIDGSAIRLSFRVGDRVEKVMLGIRRWGQVDFLRGKGYRIFR